MSEASRFESPIQVTQQHHRPVRAVGVLLVCVITGVDDQGVIHHRSIAFRHAFESLHGPDKHFAVVLPNLDPNRITRLIHVPKVMPLLLHTNPFPSPKNLSPPRTNGQGVGDTCFEGRNPKIQQNIVPTVSNSGALYREPPQGRIGGDDQRLASRSRKPLTSRNHLQTGRNAGHQSLVDCYPHGSELLNLVHHTRTSFMLFADFTR